MNTIQFAVGTLLVAVSAVSLAATSSSETTREQRMDTALQNYRSAHPDTYRGANPGTTAQGPAARAEDSVKRGAHKAGSAIKRGAHKTKEGAESAGHAIGSGARSAASSVRRTGQKMGGHAGPAPSAPSGSSPVLPK